MLNRCESELFSHRALAAAGIVTLHVLVGYLLVTGLMPGIVAPAPLQMTGVVIERPVPTPAPARPLYRPSAVLASVTPILPALPPDNPPENPALPAPAPAAAADAAGPGTAVPPALRLIGRNHLPDTEDYYPDALRRLGVQGAADVRVCVDENGVRQGEPILERTSGNARLDAGALNVARHGQYARAVRGDAPVPTCHRFRVVFRMR